MEYKIDDVINTITDVLNAHKQGKIIEVYKSNTERWVEASSFSILDYISTPSYWIIPEIIRIKPAYLG